MRIHHKKNKFDYYVNKGKEIENQQTKPTIIPSEINEITNKINEAKNDLHGEEKLEHDKNQAKENINQLNGLNQAQKDKLLNDIKQAQTRPEINRILYQAQPLNQAMENLRQSIQDENTVKQSSNYINEIPTVQHNYDSAVDKAKEIINQTTNPTMNPSEIDNITSDVTNTKNNLHGERILNKDKQTLTNAVNHLDYLNQAQKDALNHEIDQASTVTKVDNVYKKAEALDNEMKKLKDIVAEQDSVRNTSNYVNEDSSAQQAYNNAINQAQAIIDQTTNPTMSQNDIENAINHIKEKVAALDGEHKLQQAKENANHIIDSLNHLNNPQTNAEKSLINNAKTIVQVNQQITDAQELNSAMGDLRNSIQDQDTVRQNSNYINENNDKKDAYDNAVRNAEDVINEQHATLNKDTVNHLTQVVNQAKDALKGADLLNNDKQKAHQEIPTFNHLNQAQKDKLNELISNAPTRTKVDEIVSQAEILNNMMKHLEDSIKDKDQILHSSNYINEDPDQQHIYDNAVNKVEQILNQTTDPTMLSNVIQQVIDNVFNAKNQLQGQNKLNQAKDLADKELSKLNNLTSSQISNVNNQIYKAQTRTEVTQALEKAKVLNHAMKDLKDFVDQSNQVLNSSKFINEDEPQKEAYNQALENAENTIHKQTNPEMNPNVINELTHQLEIAQNNLHGDQKLAQAQQDAANIINGLTHLNPAQHEALMNNNTNATTREQVANNLNHAQTLNQAMDGLDNVVANKNKVLNSSKYLNEDPKYQQLYNQAIADAEQLAHQTSNPTLEPYQVNIIKNRVLRAEKDLLGVEKLAYDKADANDDINRMKHLNNAQKQTIIQSVNHSTLRTEVAQILQQAKNLNEVMKSLQDEAQNITEEKASPNYTEASKNRKDAVDHALTQAQSIIDIVNGSNANQDLVQQAINQLTQAVQNLDGDQRIKEAKTEAINTIHQLHYLNPSQQQSTIDNVERATQLKQITNVKLDAQTLNKAMGRLKQFINNEEAVEHSDNYRQSSDDKIEAYDGAIENGKHLIQTNASQSQVEQAIKQIVHAMNNLNGLERLIDARPKALDYINALDKLNHAQKAALDHLVNQSHDLLEIQHLEDEGTNLNDIMHSLSKTIVDNYAPTKASINYINADSQLKDDFNKAIQNARDVLNKANGQNFNYEQVDNLIDAITNAKDALNGVERLRVAKEKANKLIEKLSNINKAQLAHAIKDIANTDSLTKLSRLVNRALDLDDEMQSLKDALNQNASPVQSSSNYINADDDLKQQFDHALSNARKALDKATGGNLDESQIEGLKQVIIITKNALNGVQRLAEAKERAINYVQKLTHLNDAQQQLAEKEINSSEGLKSLTEKVSKITELDEAMKDLHDALINNSTPVHSSINYINADEDLQSQFDHALQQARNQLSKSTGEAINTDEVRGIIQAMNDTKNALNGIERLASAKSKAEKHLSQLKDLNNAQREDAIKQVNDTDNLQDLAQIVSTATDLNGAMKDLKDKLKATVNPVKASINYVNADYDLKRQFNKAVKEAREALSKTKGKNLNERDIQGLSQVINDTKDALNGIQRLNETKSKANQLIKQLNQLNNAQESSIKQRIDDSDNIKDITNIVNEGTDLNDAMKNLKDVVDQLDQSTKESINYKNADEDLKLEFDHTINLANNVLNKKEGTNLDTDVINGMAQAIVDAKDALNGEQRLKEAQTHAHKAIDNALKRQLDEINHANASNESKAQAKKVAEDEANKANAIIDHATTNTDVNNAEDNGTTAIKNTHADELPKAKNDANNEIDQKVNNLKDQIDRNSNLTSQEKEQLKEDIKKAIDNIKKHIDQATNTQTVVDEKTKVDQLINDTRAIISAKEEAKQAIKDLAKHQRDSIKNNSDLTDSQKAHALEEIDKAEKDTLKQIENSNSVDHIHHITNDGLHKMTHINIWDTDQEPTVIHRPALSLQNAIVTGKVIVHRDATITLDDIKKALTLTDGLKVNIVSLPSTNKVANDLTAKVEISLADGTQVIVDVPVDVIEKELQVAKDDAVNQINQTSQHKLDEIDHDSTLTNKQKEQSKAEVEKLKNHAIDKIKNSTTVNDVEKNQNKDNNEIQNFDPKQYTLDKAKSENKEEVDQLTHNGEEEIKHILDLTPKEQEQFNKQLQDLESNVVEQINHAKNLDELKRLVDDFKAKRNQIIAQAHLLGEKHKAERNLDNAVNNKTQEILDNTSVSEYQKQLTINHIREIQIETLNAINSAKTIEEVQRALFEGLRRIMAVSMNGTFDSISNQVRAINKLHHDDVRLRERDVQSHINQTESYKEVLSETGVKPGKKVLKNHAPKHIINNDDAFFDRIIDDFKKAVGFITLTGLLSGFWLVLAKKRKKDEVEEEMELKKEIDEFSSDTKKVDPLIIAKRKKDDDKDTMIKDDDKKAIPVVKHKKDKDEKEKEQKKIKHPSQKSNTSKHPSSKSKNTKRNSKKEK